MSGDDLPTKEPLGWDGSDEKGAYALACEAVAATKCGRVLVSLAEANQLAERLQKKRDTSGLTTMVMPARFGSTPILPVESDTLDLFQREV